MARYSILFLFLPIMGFAQNVIIKKNGNQIMVRIIAYQKEQLLCVVSENPYEQAVIPLDSITNFREPMKKRLKYLSRLNPKYASLNNTCRSDSKADSILARQLEPERDSIRKKIKDCVSCNTDHLTNGLYLSKSDFYNNKITSIGDFTLEIQYVTMFHIPPSPDLILYRLRDSTFKKKLTYEKLHIDSVFALTYNNKLYILVRTNMGGGLIFSEATNFGRFWHYNFYEMSGPGPVPGGGGGGQINLTDNLLDIKDLSTNLLISKKDFPKLISDDIYMSSEYKLTPKSNRQLKS